MENVRKSPFNLIPALQFGLFFIGISLLVKVTGIIWGDQGLYVTSVISGILDVDAITVSVSNLVRDEELLHGPAVIAITLATITNTFVKGGIFMLFGGRKAAGRIMLSMLIVIAAGSLSLLVF